MLIDHIDGPVPMVVKGPRCITTRALIERGWLRPSRQNFPTHTYITEAGRKVLAAALADWAEALIRARFEAPPEPVPVPFMEAAE